MADEIVPEVDDTEVDPQEGQPEVDEAPKTEPFDEERAKRALTKKNSENAGLRRRLAELEPLAQKAKDLEDASKTETERLAGDRDTYKGRAETAEASLSKLQIALDTAPEGASLAQVKAVARRVTGADDDERTADAAELYELLGVTGKKAPVVRKPKETLRGGADPDEEPEETDPRKLAALIQGGPA